MSKLSKEQVIKMIIRELRKTRSGQVEGKHNENKLKTKQNIHVTVVEHDTSALRSRVLFPDNL